MIKMFKRFSITNDAGIEIFCYPLQTSLATDPQMFSALINAIQSMATEISSSIKALQFEHGYMYIKHFGNYHLRLYFTYEVADKLLNTYFTEINDIVSPYVYWIVKDAVISLESNLIDELYLNVKPYLLSIIEETRRMHTDFDYYDLSIKDRIKFMEYERLKKELNING